MSANTVKTETEKTTAAAAPPKKKGRPARAKTAEVNGNAAPVEDLTNGHANGTTANGTANGEEGKTSAKRKRDDEPGPGLPFPKKPALNGFKQWPTGSAAAT